MPFRCAVLDDYQHVAPGYADWNSADIDVTFYDKPLGGEDAVVAALRDFDIICLMRERTPFPASVIAALPNLKLIVTTGMRNNSIDGDAARARGIPVCGTPTAAHPTAELVFAHLLEFCRGVGSGTAALKAGTPWQTRVGIDLSGKTFGVVGLGRLGSRVAQIASVFGMKVIAWSENLTPEKCAGTAAAYATRAELFATSDFISIHLQLSARTTGLIDADDIARMKSTAFIINTARSPIIDQNALIAALRDRRIAGAGLDVYDVEPLPLDHPYRGLENVQITPHMGYVTEDNYRLGYGHMVENIKAFLSGDPVRVINP